MEGNLFLKDVLDTNHFKFGGMNVIWAPCGSGKTTAAIGQILPLASAPHKAIYLIDTKLGNERLAREDKLIMPPPYYDDSIARSQGFWGEGMDKVCVTTYAQFGAWCRKHPHFEENYEYILCDEPQNLVNFSEIGKYRQGEIDIPVHKIARKAICDAVNRSNVMVVGITATPKPLEKLDCDLYCVPIENRENLRHFTENKQIPYASIDSVLAQIQLGMRGGIYMTRVKQMIAVGNRLREQGHNPLMLWSLANTDYPLSAEQLRARKFIIENEAVPDEYDIFLFNATAETSINLRNPIDFFIANNPNETSITQSRGRYRVDIDTLFIYDTQGSVIVPDAYLNRNLTRKELGELREQLHLKKDAKGHQISIDDMLDQFKDCGYNVDYQKVKRKDTFVIRLK